MQLRLSSDDLKPGSHIQNPLTQLLPLMLLQGQLPPMTFDNAFFCKFQMFKKIFRFCSILKFTCGKHWIVLKSESLHIQWRLKHVVLATAFKFVNTLQSASTLHSVSIIFSLIEPAIKSTSLCSQLNTNY